MILAPAILAPAQSKKPPSTAVPKLVLSVPKTTYKVGEAIETTITLENAGTEGFFAYKSLWDGFELELLDEKERPFCHVDSQIVCIGKKKRRSLGDILDQDFVFIPVGAFIGVRSPLRTSCGFLPSNPRLAPGKYHVTVAYDPHANCAPDLSKEHTKFPVLQSTIEGTPVEVELTD